MTTLSAQEIMLAAGLVVGLAMICQVVAPLLRIPALILLLPTGFLLGLAAPQFRMDQVLGPAFSVGVDLIVALILFQGGMELGNITLRPAHRSVVRRLVWIGGPLTWIAGSVTAHYLLDLSWSIAMLLGAILVVSGPTVVTPILDLARPTHDVRGILMSEGTMLDPIGGIFAVVIFQLVRVSDSGGPLEGVVAFAESLVVAVLVAAVGALVAVLGNKMVRGNRTLGVQALAGTVLATAAFANFISEDSGLLAALLMGVATPAISRRLGNTLEATIPFFNIVASFGIGILFISITALVPSPLVATVALPAIGMALVLMLVVRPLVAALCTGGAGLSRNERAFIGWMDPRGIVAAATASSVGAALVAAEVPGAAKLLPAAFVIIAVTVFVYGLTATPVVKALGIQETEESPQPAHPA